MLVHELAGRETIRRSIDALTAIKSEIQHCGGTINNLIDFIRPYDAEMTSLNIKRVIRDSVKLVRTYLQKQNINIDIDVSRTLPAISADAVH